MLALSKADLVDDATRGRPRAPRWTRAPRARRAGDRDLLGRRGSGSTSSPASCCGASRAEEPADAAIEISPASLERPTSSPSTACSGRPAQRALRRCERSGEGSYRVTGTGIERLVARYDLDNEDALAHLERRLRGIGVIRALEAQGFEPGDEVEIAGVAFDLDPSV